MKTLPLAEVKAHLSALVSEVETQHEHVTVTRNGAPAAIVVSVDEWESLQETIAVLSDRSALDDLAEAAGEREAGKSYSTEEILEAWRHRRTQSA